MTSIVDILIVVCMRMGFAIQVGTAPSKGSSATNYTIIVASQGFDHAFREVKGVENK